MLTVEQQEKLNGLDFMHGGGFPAVAPDQLEEYRLSQPLVQLPFGAADTPARLLRMNWMLYERLKKTCEVL